MYFYLNQNHMTGAIMQLVCYGAEDIYLTDNPSVTFFKSVYRRHTNFATECIEQTFNGTVNFGKKVSALISRNGDMVSGIYIETTLPDISVMNDTLVNRWTDHVGHFLLKDIEVEIGGQVIDKHNGDWLEIWSQLTLSAGHRHGYYEMIGQDRTDALGRPTGLQRNIHGSFTRGRKIYIPLQFWFCRNTSASLPLLALRFHEIVINVEFANIYELVRRTTVEIEVNALINTKLWIDYIYLDVDERRRFSNNMHEYLIEQVQYNGDIQAAANGSRTTNKTVTVPLNFNHPVKELIWVVQSQDQNNDAQPANYTSLRAPPPLDQLSTTSIDNLESLGSLNTLKLLSDITNQSCVKPSGALNPVIKAKLQINGHDRIETHSGIYFNQYQPLKHHTNIPVSPGINVYSFSMYPEKLQPSGTCNFSRVTSSALILQIATLQNPSNRHQYPGIGTIVNSSSQCTVKVYALSNNVFRVAYGLGGAAYRN
jgi:hypothetical protein